MISNIQQLNDKGANEMKKIVLIMAMVFGLVATAFAYDEVRLNNDGNGMVEGLNVIYYGKGVLTSSDGHFSLCNIDKKNLNELPSDRDTYCLLYSIVNQYGCDWVILESKNYIALTGLVVGGWREYRVFKKTGGKAGKYLYKPQKLMTWDEILSNGVFEK